MCQPTSVSSSDREISHKDRYAEAGAWLRTGRHCYRRFRVGAYRGTITRLFEEAVQDFLRRYSGREFSIPRRSTVRTLNFYCDPFSLTLLVDRIDIGITLTRETNNGTPLIGNSLSLSLSRERERERERERDAAAPPFNHDVFYD